MKYMSQLYVLLDCGNGRKLEKFGQYLIIRPCPQAMWQPFKPELWNTFDLEFIRTTEEKGIWQPNPSGPNNLYKLPPNWQINSPNGLVWQVEPNDFGNVGVFFEHWEYAPSLVEFFGKKVAKVIEESPELGVESWDENEFNSEKTTNSSGQSPTIKILNLFTYSGSNCVSLVKAGLGITAVDSSKTAMDLYNKNLDNNKLKRDGQRMILEDVDKFVEREIRRNAEYDGVMIDAPSYGRGRKGELFKIEENLVRLLKSCQKLLKPSGKLVLTLHSPRFTPKILEILVAQIFADKQVECSEILQKCQSGAPLPSGFLVKVS
jgi:23S rRNA (cytosine1962-C5)-methyltransferase